MPLLLLNWEEEPMLVLALEKAWMGLGVGDTGLRRRVVPLNDGDRDGCSEALLNEGVAGVYCSRVLICEDG